MSDSFFSVWPFVPILCHLSSNFPAIFSFLMEPQGYWKTLMVPIFYCRVIQLSTFFCTMALLFCILYKRDRIFYQTQFWGPFVIWAIFKGGPPCIFAVPLFSLLTKLKMCSVLKVDWLCSTQFLLRCHFQSYLVPPLLLSFYLSHSTRYSTFKNA